MYADSPVRISADEGGSVTISVNKSVKVVLTDELIDAIVAVRKKAKVKKCWIDRPVPPYYWEDYNGKIGKARKATVQRAARNEGD